MCRRGRTCLSALAFFLFCSAAARAGGRPLEIAVSVAPLAQLVATVGGADVRITVLSPDGSVLESWAPTPREALALVRADLYVSVGHPLLAFESRFLALIADEVGALDQISMAGGGRGRPRESDPHLWMDIDLLATTAERVAEWLMARRPERSDEVQLGLRAYLSELQRVDATLRELLSPGGGRPVVLQHPAWTRLLERYGVESLSIETEGKEPAPAGLVRLVERTRDLGVETVFTQIGVSDRGARLIAGEIGAELVALDPAALEWIETLHSAGEAFARASR